MQKLYPVTMLGAHPSPSEGRKSLSIEFNRHVKSSQVNPKAAATLGTLPMLEQPS